jgi:hypothetical protein
LIKLTPVRAGVGLFTLTERVSSYFFGKELIMNNKMTRAEKLRYIKYLSRTAIVKAILG